MNKIESVIYNFIKYNPRLKNLVRDIYQAMLYLVPVTREKSAYPVIVREGFFFGFHDKNPWSADNKYLLAHGYHGLQNKVPKMGDQIDIGFFKGDNFSSFQKVTSASCYNWQQGSMLQWLGRSNKFIFNDAGGEDNIAKIFDIEGKAWGILPKAVSAVSPDGEKALSYNFARLQRHYYPGYGYVHGHDPEIEAEAPSSHGISIIDIQKNLIVKLFSIRDIASIHPEKSMSGAFHFLTHCLFSPSGQRFLFLHRWVKDDNFTFTRMFSCDLNGKNLHLFPTHDMVSHIAWQDDSHVFAYTRSTDDKDAYILFGDMSNEFRLIGTKDFNSDGHPSFPGNSTEWFVTDTYPDRFQISHLVLYSILKEKRFDLGSFRQPYLYRGEVRCDLHPRWNNDGTMICFDSAHSGKRSLCTMNIGDSLTTGIIKPF